MKTFVDSAKQQSVEAPGRPIQPILVELRVRQQAVRSVFEEALRGNERFRIKQADDFMAAQLTIHELDADTTRALEMIQTIRECSNQRDYFLTASQLDSHILLEALRAGIKEFLPQPVRLQEVNWALNKYAGSETNSWAAPSKRKGQIISVFGSSGGVGTTSLAVNVAVALKNADPSHSVVLVEVDQQSGNLPVYLDLYPSYTFRDIANDLSRLDETLATEILLDHESGIRILPSGYDNLSSGQLQSDCVQPTLSLLSSLFTYVLVDCGHTLESTTQHALELSDTILLATNLCVPIIQRTQRLLQAFDELGLKAQRKLVLSRYLDGDHDLAKETESILGQRAFWHIPEHTVLAHQAINQGKPSVLGDPRSPLAKSYVGLAHSLAGENCSERQNVSWTGHLRKLVQKGRAKFKAEAA